MFKPSQRDATVLLILISSGIINLQHKLKFRIKKILELYI